jgi:hypothetical protein
MANFFSDLLSGFTGPGATVASGLIGLGGNIAGAVMGSNAASDAADTTAATARMQAAQMRESKDKGLGYIDQGTADYTSTIAPLLTERPITMPTFQGLTAQQELGREDLLRSGKAALASSGLRGAGRAGIGTVLDQVGRYTAAARGGNDSATLAARTAARGQADSARAGLAGVRANAGTAKANTELGVGSALSGIYGQAGATQAGIQQQTGQMMGNLAASTGRLVGNTLSSAVGQELGNSPNAPQPITYPGWQQQQRYVVQ